MTLDVKAEFKELEKDEHEELKQNSVIQRIIQTAASTTKEYRFGELSIRIRSTIPKDMRRVVTQLRKLAAMETTEDDEEVLLDRSEDLFYLFLSRICLDDPFDKVETWQIIDTETGAVPGIAVQIIELCGEAEKKVAEFRTE